MQKPLIPAQDVDDYIIIRAVNFVNRMQRVIVRDALREEGLALLEWRLLFSIARFGSCYLAFVTRHTAIDPAHGSRAATALEAKGLITRHDDPANKRRKLMSLTPEGVAAFGRVWPLAQGRIRSITSQISRSELDEFKRLMDLFNGTAAALLEGEDGPQDDGTEDDGAGDAAPRYARTATG